MFSMLAGYFFKILQHVKNGKIVQQQKSVKKARHHMKKHLKKKF